MSWFAEVSMLSRIRVPRCLQFREEVTSATLHVYVDTSKTVYVAVIYMRSEYIEGKYHCHL